jgi:diguanylate cyclase (GGDEF)-like protein/PAS domain S-box-containing protein
MDPKPNFRILIIDDNLAIHQDFMKILTSSTSGSSLDNISSELFGTTSATVSSLPQFEIDTASQGKEGVEHIKKAIAEKRPYSLAFVDIRMPPGWDGVETIKHIWEIDKDIQVVICTAYSDYSWEETIAQLGTTDNLLILKKPFDNSSVRQLAHALTRKWQLIQNARQYTDNLKQQVLERTESLQTSLSLVKATLESSSDGILVVNNDGIIIDHNQKFVDMWKLSDETLRGSTILDILSLVKSQVTHAEKSYNKIRELQADHDKITIDNIYFADERIFECYTQPHKLDDKTIGRVYDFRDVSKRVKLEKELLYQATHDSLTGLPNRVSLHEHVQDAIKKSAAENKSSSFALLFFDLDRFKLINDSLSHAVGDELLKATAGRLQAILNKDDILARLGGDEFVIIFSGEDDVMPKIQSVLNVFQQPFYLGGRSMMITASMGVSLYPKDGGDIDELLKNADAAMYRAKSLLGNNFQFYTPEMNTQNLAKLDLEDQLTQALVNKEFFLVYQPQLDLASEKLVAVEALLRWQHPEKGVLLPMDFVPTAEETGLIVPIGEWVIRTACQQNKEWQKAGISNIKVAVNISSQQLLLPNFHKSISNILTETGLQPEFLELELAENVIVNNGNVINIVKKLKELGVKIVIGDFGTSYSNLSYLQKVPLDSLKIDRSFIQQIQHTNDSEVIVRAIIAMAKSLSLDVLAEGVETQNQLEFLQKYDGGNVQGFYFGKPLSLDEVEKLLKSSKNLKDMSTLITPPK